MKILISIIILAALCVSSAIAQDAKSDNMTLEQALSTAFKNSPSIKITLDQVIKSKAGIDKTLANYNPQASVGLTHLMQGPAVSIKVGDISADLVPAQNTTGKFSIAMPIDISRQIGYASDLTKLQYQVDYLSYQISVNNLIYNVKNAYFNLLRAQAGLEVAQTSFNNTMDRLANTKAKYDVGSVPKFDVTRAEVEVANINQQVLAAKNGVKISRAAFNNVIGINVSEPTNVEKQNIVVLNNAISTEDMKKKALANRPEIKTAKTYIELSKKNIKLQKTSDLPSLALSGDYNYNFTISGFNATNSSWMAVANLSIPIWTGGVTRAKVNEAKAGLKIADDSYEQAKLGIELAVQIAISNLEDARERVTAAFKSVELAEESYRLAVVRYDAGISTQVEVTDSNTALSQAKYNYVNAQYDYVISQAALELATASQPEALNVIK